MPQASSISGVGATVESKAYQGGASDMIALAEAFSKIQESKKTQAQQSLKIMLDNIDKLPIDDKAIRKVAKQAGLPLADDGTISAIAHAAKSGAQPQGGAAKNPQEIPSPAQLGKGGDSTTQKDPNAAAQQAHQKMEADFQKKSPEEKRESVFTAWAAKARALSDAKFKDETAKAEYNTQITSIKTAAVAGDPIAMGRLMAVGEMPFNITQLAWDNSTDKQRDFAYNVAIGHESETERNVRKTSIYNANLAHGMNAADAAGIAETLANGQALSPEQQKKAGEPSFKELGEQADMLSTLTELGVPNDRLQATAQCAREVGIINCLPKGLQPMAQQKMKLMQQQANASSTEAGAAVARVGVEKERVKQYGRSLDIREQQMKQNHQLAWTKLQLMQVQGKNKEFTTALTRVISAKKAGITINDKDMEKVMDGLKKFDVTDDPQEFLNHASGQQVSPVGNAVDQDTQ